VLEAALMDAVMFNVKGAHLALQRVGRLLLRQHELTPARFDLMHALGPSGAKQSDLWKRLDVVRSAVCEMVTRLIKLGLLERVRAGRTWIVALSARGRSLMEAAWRACIESGATTTRIDDAFGAESDVAAIRQELLARCGALRAAFRAQPRVEEPDLYIVVGSRS
jgi:DNA-binding MarR family transcriptional regulator